MAPPAALMPSTCIGALPRAPLVVASNQMQEGLLEFPSGAAANLGEFTGPMPSASEPQEYFEVFLRAPRTVPLGHSA